MQVYQKRKSNDENCGIVEIIPILSFFISIIYLRAQTTRTTATEWEGVAQFTICANINKNVPVFPRKFETINVNNLKIAQIIYKNMTQPSHIVQRSVVAAFKAAVTAGRHGDIQVRNAKSLGVELRYISNLIIRKHLGFFTRKLDCYFHQYKSRIGNTKRAKLQQMVKRPLFSIRRVMPPLLEANFRQSYPTF